MHYRGFVIVPEPTDAAVAAVMAPHEEQCDEDPDDEETEITGKWDWYRAGGRYDGYLVSDAEMTARETDNGFNFQPENARVDRNCLPAHDLPTDRRNVYFFVVDGQWIDFDENQNFQNLLDKAIADHPDHWVVVVDAHS